MENASFEQNYLEDLSFGRPHVVVLGAGASLASFPNGDKNGKRVPLMSDLIEVAKLDEILGEEYVGKNIEEVFTALHKDPSKAEILNQAEKRLFEYFEDFELPDEPTMYDHLILSLRKKDIIASFNWDPFLFKAVQRNAHLGDMPMIVFLHGNVAIGYCAKCPQFGEKGGLCSICRGRYVDGDLLYPIGEKNYDKDPVTKSAWSVLRKGLKSAYILTIFGYRAPDSDKKALEIFKEAWGPSSHRELEEIEIIHRPGLTEEQVDEITGPWEELIHTHHYGTFDSIYHSQLMLHPRRSCECFWSAMMELKPREDCEIPKDVPLWELQSWLEPIFNAEKEKAREGSTDSAKKASNSITGQ